MTVLMSLQIEHAKAYAERKGWMVDEAAVFIDDGISGAEFANRPGFVRLMNALKVKCSSFHRRGKTVCANSHEMPLQAADEAVSAALIGTTQATRSVATALCILLRRRACRKHRRRRARS
jgi:Resolvase, N terminal domain